MKFFLRSIVLVLAIFSNKVFSQSIYRINCYDTTYCDCIKAYPCGQVCQLKDSLSDGIYYSYYDTLMNNIAVIAEYQNGVRNGLYKEYYQSGPLMISEEYKCGKRDGASIFFNEDRTINRLIDRYSNGVINGSLYSYRQTGQIDIYKKYKQGILIFQEEYQNGILKRRLFFENDQVIKTEEF